MIQYALAKVIATLQISASASLVIQPRIVLCLYVITGLPIIRLFVPDMVIAQHQMFVFASLIMVLQIALVLQF